MRNLLKLCTIIGGLSFVVMGFQNCSGKGFSTSEVASASENSGTSLTANGNFETGVESNGDLVQIQGHFNSDGGNVLVDGNILAVNIQAINNQGSPVSNGSGSGQPIIVIEGVPGAAPTDEDIVGQIPDGRFRICAKLDKPGDQNIEITQENDLNQLLEILIPTFTTQMSVEEMVFDVTHMAVLSPSSGEVTIRCVPNSTVTSQIYGNDQLGAGLTCSAEGTLTFNVSLVPSFANTGNRVVVITQTLENGSVSTISVDIDNTVSTHQCSITGGSANTDICVDTAGTVSGNCKAGLPVKLFVNNELQEVVTCQQNGQFEVNNVLLPHNNGAHEIRIEQDSPFTVTCSDSQVINQIIDLNK